MNNFQSPSSMFDANSVIFIDSQVQGFNDLITEIPDNTRVHHLGSRQDGVEQISQILAQYQNLDAVYIFSHGSEGSLDLGTTILNQETLNDYRHSISGWSQALSDDADLLFFGCNVAQGEQGQAFIQKLDELTGADIAASTDLTGHAALGGDWTLEATTGNIESYQLFAADSLTNYGGTLASLSNSLTGTQDFSGKTTVDGNLSLEGDVTLNVDDFILGEAFTIAGDNQGKRDNLTINAEGKVTIAGDIFGGGLQNITINAKDIEIQGTSLISTRFIEGTDYDTDVSIADSGNLTLAVSGKALHTSRVAIQEGAELFTHVGDDDTETAGNITITALDETVQTNLASFPTRVNRSASIEIDGVTIKGEDVTISASGLDPKLFGGVVDFPGVKLLDRVVIDPLLERTASLLQGFVLPASVEVRKSHAEATVTGSSIDASGAVTIGTEATADGSVRSYRATRTPNDSGSTLKQGFDFTSHIAVAVGYAETNAVTTIKDTQITADSNVSLTSANTTSAAVNARLFGNLQAFEQGASENNWGLAGAVSVTDTTSKVLLDAGSSINSDGNVVITSDGKVASGAKATTKIYTTGNVAGSFAVNHDDTDVETIVHGDITAAGKLTETAEPTLIKRDKVDSADNTISFGGLHGFINGETVTYKNEGDGGDISGLANEQPYFVHIEDDKTIKLSRGAALDVDALGTNNGAVHSLSRQETRDITQVDVDTDRITLENHGLLTGQQVSYRSNADEGEGIDGLFEEAAYYVRVVDKDTLELAEDLDQLVAGQKVDIESVGDSANSYELEFHEQEELVQRFSPEALVDLDADTLTLNDHGFYNGQLVRYNSSSNSDRINGLEDEQHYFVIVKDKDTIQLAATRQDVNNLVAVDLTTQGSGTDHRLTGIQNTTRFEAKKTVDSDKEIFTLNNHGFQTGDAVVYNTDDTFSADAPTYINRTIDPTQHIDIANDTLSIAAQTLETGDKVLYQAAYALDPDSAQYQAIGGLTSDTEYYLIKLDDNTVQLAASKEQALANEAIDLTAAGKGLFHTLFSEGDETIRVDDREIRGLEAGEVYFVSVIDGGSFRLTQTQAEAVDAEFVDFDDKNFGGTHRLERQDPNAPLGITLEANLTVTDRSIAEGAARSTPKVRDYLRNPDLMAALAVSKGGLLNQTKAGNILKGEGNSPFDKGITGKNQHSAGFGVALNLVDHKVQVEVGSSSNGANFDTLLNSGNNIRVHSGIEQKVQTRAGGATGKSASTVDIKDGNDVVVGTKNGHALGLAFGYSDYDNTAQAIIHGNAQLNAEDAIDVTSKVEYPFLLKNLFNLSDSEGGDLSANFDQAQQREAQLRLVDLFGIDVLFGGNLLASKVANTYALTKNTGKIKEGKIEGGAVGFNGTVVVNNYDNTSEALIKSGAQINQKTKDQSGRQSVNVQADTNMVLVGLVGILHTDIALDLIHGGVKKKGWQSVFNPWGNTAQNGVGVSFFRENIHNKTIAKIEQGSKIHTGSEGTGLDIAAKEKLILIGLAQSGSQVEGYGITGSGSNFDHISHTIAQIEAGVTVTGGPVSVVADSDALRINSAMTLVNTKHVGVGVSVAIDESDRYVRAVIGNAKEDDAVLSGYQINTDQSNANTSIDVSGDINVSAKTTGAVVSAALGINWLSPTGPITPGDKKKNITTSITAESLKNLFGVTGGVAGNVQTESVKAYIYDAEGNGKIKARGGDLNVNSENQTLTLALGALLTAAFPGDRGVDLGNQNDGGSADGAAPSNNQNVLVASLGAAFNEVDHTTSAFLKGVEIEANNLQIAAEKDRDEGSRTLAIAFTPSLTTSSTGEGTFTANVSGAVALNLINSTTESYADNSTLQIKGLTTFSAADKSAYYAAGGALALGVLRGSSNYRATATLGFGFGLNQINSTTQSYLDRSTLTALSSVTNPNSQINITALSDFESVALSLSGAISSNTGVGYSASKLSFSGAVTGAVSLNKIEQNTVSAYISNSVISAPTQHLTLQAKDSSRILGIGGGVSISAITNKDKPLALSLGVSAAVNTFENTEIEAYLSKSTVFASDVTVTAASTAESGAYAIIGAGAGTSASSTSKSFSGAFAGAGAGTGNYGSSKISAQVLNDTLIHTHALAIHALDDTKLKSYAIGVSVAASINSSANAAAAGAGVAVALNEVRNDVHANIKGASTVTRLGNHGQVDIDLVARSSPEITSVNVAGAAAVAGSSNGELGLGIAAGVSVAHSTLSNTVTATVEEGSSIQNGGIVSVKALLGQVDEENPSTLHTVGGSASLTAAWSKKLGFGLAVAASVARNYVKDNTVLAAIDNATVTASGDITITADLSPAVDATNFGVAVGVGVGSGNSSSIGLAGAGIGSYNTLTNNTTEASVTNGANVTSQAGNATLKATDATHLKAHGGTGALAIGVASGGLGLSAAIGAAVAKNKLSNTTKADISGATVKAHQNLTVEAQSDNNIDALNIGVGAAAAGSKDGGGIGLAGAGIGSFNTLSNTVTATIQAGANATSEDGAVQLSATDTSTIKADGGAVSLALGGGTGVGVGAAIGAAIAKNELSNTTEATINAATVNAKQDITVEALADNTIDALNIGVGAAVGGSKDGAGIGLAGAGAGSFNTLSNTVTATIQSGADATSQDGAVHLSAVDTSTIKADGGAGSLALGGSTGSTGIAVGVGIAIAENTLKNTLKASIDRATVTAKKDVLLNAANQNADGSKFATIEALSVGASLALAAGSSAGVALSGAGVGADNTIGNTIEASIKNAQVTSNEGKVSLNAKDQSKIDAQSYVVSVSGAAGSSGAGAAAIGMAKATNTLNNKVKAFIGQADGATDNSHIKAEDLDLIATSDTKIDAKIQTASVAIAFNLNPYAPVAFSLAGSGVIADNTIGNTIEAAVYNGSTLEIADNIDVEASDTNTVDAYYGLGSGGFGLGAGVAIAVAVIENTLNNTIHAYMDDVRWADSDQANATLPNVTIQATETATITTDNRFASVGVGIVGLAGAGATSTTTIESDTQAYAKGSEDWSVGDLTIEAISDTTSDAKVHGGAGAGAIGVAAGASVATVEDNSKATAYFDLDSSAVLNAKDVEISAIATPKATANALFVAVSGVGFAGAGTKAKATINPTVTAYVGDDTIIYADDVTVHAEQVKPENGDASVQALATTGEGGVGLSLGFTKADAHAHGNVTAYIANNAQIFTNSDVTVEAINNTHQFAGKDGVANGGFNIGFSGGNLHANTHSDKTTKAYLGNNVALVAQNLTLQATGENQTNVKGVTFGGAGLIAGRSGHTETQSNSTTQAYIGNGSTSRRLKVFNTVDLDANYTNTFDKDLVVGTGALLAAGSGANATHIIDATVEANFGNNLQLEAGDIQIDALNTSRKLNKDKTSLRSSTGSLGLSVAKLESSTHIEHHTNIKVGSGAKLQQNSATATNGIDAKAKNIIDVQEIVKAESYNLISGGGSSKAETIVESNANIGLGQGSLLDATGDINLNSHSYNQARTVSEVSTSGLISGGKVNAKTEVTPHDTITLSDDAKVLSQGEIALTAGISGTDVSGTEESDSSEHSRVEANAKVTMYTLIPVTSRNASKVETIYNRTHTITVNEGAEIASAQDTRLFAHEGTPDVSEISKIHHLYGAKNFDDGVSQNDSIGVTVNGTVRSHRVAAKTLTFEEDANGTIRAVHGATVDGEERQLGSTETVGAATPDGVTIYQGSFGGDRKTLNVGRYANLADGTLSSFNDEISSLKVTAGYQAVLYTEENFQGDRIVITADTNLSQLNNFNNRVSSLEILHDKDAVIGYRDQTNAPGKLETVTLEEQNGQIVQNRVSVTKSYLRGDLTNLYIGDFNGDGRDDFIRQEKGHRDDDNNGTAHLYLSHGNGTFKKHNLSESYALKGDLTNLYIGDFNGDGKDDFIRQEKGRWDDDNNGTAHLYLSHGNGTFKKHNLSDELKGDLTNLYIGDFNGDGKDDFLRQEKGRWDDDSNNTANVYLSNGNGTFKKHNLPDSYALKGDLTNLYIGDFNGDNKDDFLRQSKTEDAANIFLSNGNGTFAKKSLSSSYALRGDLTNLYIGDFNGDNKDDFLRQEKGSRDNDNVNTANVYLSNGNGTFAKHNLPNELKGDYTNLYIGDFNGDHKDDFIRQEKGSWDNDQNNTANVFFSSGNGSFDKRDLPEGFNLGGDNGKLHVGDFSGDGTADFLQQLKTNDNANIVLMTPKAEQAAAEAQAIFQTQFSSTAQVGNIPFIEVDDTSLNLGRILVTGGYLTGKGTLDASANSKIEILNHSSASLRINDIDISDTGGGLYFNYAPMETDDTQTVATVKTLATHGRPEVNIQNTSDSRTVIQLNGDIDNLLGTIRVDNAVGDTLVNGNLRAHTIDIVTGGSLIQGYISGTRHLGGNPESQWWSTAEASAQANQKIYKGSTGGSSAIIGDNVFIAGEYINVNGTIQAGSANHSVKIDNNAQFQQAVASFNQQYNSNNSKYLFDFKASGHGITKLGDSNKLVRLQWNARDQQIEAHSIDATGGYLELHGHIFSTGNGQLKALDGYSQIRIENNTNYDLQLNALTNNEASGKIKITDTSRSGNSPHGFHVTEIERLGNTIHQNVNGNHTSTTAGRSAIYNPKDKQVYRFETEQQRLETKYKRRVERGTALGSKFFRRVTNRYTEDRSGLKDEAKGTVNLRPGSGRLTENIDQTLSYQFEKLDQKPVSFLKTGEKYRGLERASTYRSWDYDELRTYDQIHRHSIDADKAIAINFIGYDEGIVNVKSNQSNVILDGVLSNTGGDTTIEAKAISTTDEGALRSDAIALSAKNDIDLTLQGSTAGATVEATTTNGDLNLTYLDSVVNKATLTAQNGNITFTANAGINDGTFTGNNITLDAIAGDITATVDTGNHASSGLTANAQGEIRLTGTPNIHQISSPAGIYLNGEFQGTRFEGQTTSEETYQTLLTGFTEFASTTAIDNNIAAIEATKQAEYAQYWQLRNKVDGSFNPGTYTFTYSASQRDDLRDEGKSNAEIAEMEEALSEWMRSQHQALGNPTAYDANYIYRVSQAERRQLENTLTQTQQSFEAQVDILGGYQNFQTFFELVYNDEQPSGTAPNSQTPPANSTPNNSNPNNGQIIPINRTMWSVSGNTAQLQSYQPSKNNTSILTTVKRDELLDVLTKEQKDELMRSNATAEWFN